MDTIGLDLHKRESQLCIGRDDGSVEERCIVTSRERFSAVLGNRSPARVLVEASTESEWVARHLEQLGHEVIVADPNFAPMYATRSRRTKTDRRDARTLMEACRLGAYRPAYRLSDERRHVRAELAVREALVRTRTRYIALAKALVRRDGVTDDSAEYRAHHGERDRGHRGRCRAVSHGASVRSVPRPRPRRAELGAAHGARSR
jgi:transposase